MYAKEGKPAPAGMTTSVYYNRGILNAALHVEAVRLALTLTGGKPPTGADVKKGFDMIKNFSLGGLVPPLEITSADHEGGGWMQVYQVKGDKLVKDGYLSGGEREMLAIGRALISEPRILLEQIPLEWNRTAIHERVNLLANKKPERFHASGKRSSR